MPTRPCARFTKRWASCLAEFTPKEYFIGMKIELQLIGVVAAALVVLVVAGTAVLIPLVCRRKKR